MNCLFLNNVAEASSVGSSVGCLSTGATGVATGGAIESLGQSGSLTVFDSIFKNNKAIQVGTTNGGGGAIALDTVTASSGVDLLVLKAAYLN